MKRDTGFRTFILGLVGLLCVACLVPTILVYTKSNDPNIALEKREREVFKRENPTLAAQSLNLGLDLAGGTHIIVEIDKSKLEVEAQKDVLERCLEIIRNRVDQYGLSEPVITSSGDNRIVADLAGMGAEDARRLIGATALLEFKLVPESIELRPVLDRIDAFLNQRQGVKPIPGAVANDTTRALESVFGRVESDTSAQSADSASVARSDSTGTTDSTSDSANIAASVAGSRPFSSLLFGMGRDIAVRFENVEKVRAILDDPEVQQVIPTRFQFLWGRDIETLEGGEGRYRRLYFLKHRPEMTGKTIADAQFNRVSDGMNAGEMEVELSFKDLGPKEFARITGANIGRQLAIVLDSVVYSAPVIQGRIPNGRASITGIGSPAEAKQLAVTLRAGSLPAPMNIVELRSVGPTLGEDNIRKGIYSAVAAMLLVMLFMVWYYRVGGLIAGLAVIFNLVIIVAVLSAFHATLTLPGIAGMVLTIGMAVDANVLIFERIREELRAGRSLRAAIDAGYRKAFSAILDSNITTLGTAAILYYIGVGPIKGFGLTLMIGISASMYTAIGVTRLVLDYMLDKWNFKEINIGKGFEWFHKVDLKVIPWARYYVGTTLVIVALSVGVVAIKGLNLGIDFTGGHVYRVAFQDKPDVDAVRNGIEAQGLSEPQVQTLGSDADKRLLIYLPKGENDSITQSIVQKAVGSAVIEGEDTVGPSVSEDLSWAAIWSILLSCVLIVLYIWFRFGRNGLGFGLAGVIGIMHDAVITLGIYSLLGRELSLDFVAAILTIIGYSLNDSIIIFDRIRELSNNASLKDSFATRVNSANNQSLSRSVITHVTVLFTVVVLATMGGSSIRDFNIAMTIGVVVGIYSTIAVACPFVVWWDRRRIAPPKAA
jgi:SecD/SecF fusion protein